MSTKLFIIIFSLTLISSVCQEEYELIEEYIPYILSFQTINKFSYKIYEYTPSCNNMTTTKKVYIHIWKNEFIYLRLYKYSDISKIQQNSEGYFINFDSEIRLSDYLSEIDFECGMTYYLVFKHSYNSEIFRPFYCQFSFFDDILNTIDISSLFLKSRYLAFLKRTTKEEKYLYSSNEDKYLLISFSQGSNLSIIDDNNQTIYEIKADKYMTKVLEFKSGQNYIIDYNAKEHSTISFHIYNESDIFKHDFNDMPIILNGYNYSYYFEIDISTYKKGEYILFSLYDDFSKCIFVKYQFKNHFKGNNLIPLGEYRGVSNYIPIKKETEDSTLILFVKPFIYNGFSVIDIYKYKSYEINSEIKETVKGPCIYFVDYFKFNNLNSFGIQSNQKYILYEQEFSNEIKSIEGKYENVSIIINHYLNANIYRKGFILFNSTGDISLEVKKYDFPIIYSLLNRNNRSPKEYFQLCQGENTLKELYYYLDNEWDYYDEFFIPIFGNFNSSFINVDEIQDLSDFNFIEIKDNFFIFDYTKKGYLKIQCEEETMLKHFSFYRFTTKYLTTGNRFYFTGDNFNNQTYSFNISLVNKNIPIKINTYGLDSDDKIIFKLNGTKYELNNKPLEINYTYNYYKSDLIEFIVDEKTKWNILVEIIVGFMTEDLNDYEQIEFEKALGSIEIERNKGVIIKIPKDFNDTLYDYSIIFPNDNYFKYFDVQIIFDNFIYAVPSEIVSEYVFPIIPLFKVNPYSKISDSLNENKFFYITIYNKDNKDKILIKKPKLFSQFELNKINILPALNGENSKYYHQIEIPENDDNYLYFQTTNKTSYLSISNSSINYVYNTPYTYNSFINDIPLIKNNKMKFINYYNTEFDVYINIASSKDYFFKNKYYYIQLQPEIKQIKDSNKIKIKMNSLSYHFYPNQYKYVFITNLDTSFSLNLILPFLCGKQKPDKSLKQTMITIEDDGKNEIFEKEIKLDIEVDESFSYNTMTITPVIKNYNLVDFYFGKSFYYDFIYQSKKKNWVVALVISLVVIALIIIGLIIYFIKRKKNTSQNSIENIDNIENNALAQELK